MNAPRAIEYGDLSTCSDEYEEMRSVHQAVDDFYVGGHQLAARIGNYVPKLLGENARRYKERIASGSYFNYFGQITDFYAAALFTQELAIRPASDHDDPATPGGDPKKAPGAKEDVYEKFAKNADGAGKNLNEVCHGLIVTALKHRTAWLRVEMPKPLAVRTRAEEEAAGLGLPYLFEVPHEQVIDWDLDDEGELVYAVIRGAKKIKGTPGARKDSICESFEVWRAEPLSDAPLAPGEKREAIVTWARYEIEYEKKKKPKDTDPVSLVDEGETSFPRIPLLLLEIPPGLWLGNKLAPMAREHYARRTTLNSAENRSLVAIPVVKLGPEIAEPGGATSAVQQDEGRGNDPVSKFVEKGYEVLGSGDSLEFVEPTGKAYEHVAKRIDDLKNEMFRVSHQLAASASMGASSVKRSGESKKEDRAAEALVLGALGRAVRDFMVEVFGLISEARGDDVVWVAHGLDTYEHEDREQTLEESIQIQAVAIPSPTFRKEHCKRVYRKLVPNLPPQATAAIDDEIEKGIDDEEKKRKLELEASMKATKDAIDAPPPSSDGTRVPSSPGGKKPPPAEKEAA